MTAAHRTGPQYNDLGGSPEPFFRLGKGEPKLSWPAFLLPWNEQPADLRNRLIDLIEPPTALIDLRRQVGDVGHRSLHLPPNRSLRCWADMGDGLVNFLAQAPRIESVDGTLARDRPIQPASWA